MGKASRWMTKFLLGKKEDKAKRKEISFYEENVTTPCTSVPATPSHKRRWSFGKSASKERSVHLSSKSLDSIPITPQIAHAPSSTSSSLESGYHQQNNTKTVALATNEAFKTVVKVIPKYAADKISNIVEDAAATRIQAAFRSYLARKALCALRGLVKLQAVVRGHMVRKQTAATLRRMHALMAIQVRARFQRVQMAEESQLVVRSQSSRIRNFSRANGLEGADREATSVELCEDHKVLKNKHSYPNHSQIERIEQGIATYYSGDRSILRQEHQYEEFSIAMAQNSPQICSTTSSSGTIPGRASFTYQQPNYLHPVSHQYPFLPNYMTNTESSRAKFRSQSEPKQRPKCTIRQKSKQMASIGRMHTEEDAQAQCSSLHSKRIAHENQDPWFTKLHKSPRSKDIEFDAKSTTIDSYSNNSKLLVTYEPHLNLY